MKLPSRSIRILLCVPFLLANAGCERTSDWEKTWTAIQEETAAPDAVPPEALEDGPPVVDGHSVLFRYASSPDVKTVYLAGDFNGWALNNNGKYPGSWFAMKKAGDGRWFRTEELHPKVHKYSFVLEKADGSFDWIPDPHVEEKDSENHSILRLATDSAPPGKPAPVVESFLNNLPPQAPGIDLSAEKTWSRPSEPNALVAKKLPAEAEVEIEIRSPLGETIHRAKQKADGFGTATIPIPPLGKEGGFLATATARGADGTMLRGSTVLTSVENVADDLRYGFYASYGSADGDYAAKAAMLADLHVNAVEFYDYFPAHGIYAPTGETYSFEPFGIKINGLDIRKKIEAGHSRNILAIAYVAAYAASESVYKRFPHPMTDASGVPKIFSHGEVMTETEADRRGKPKWFWLMNVADDSPWHAHILAEFARAMDDSPDDIVSFDGFEIDTYGDNPAARFHAAGSKRDGDLLADVLQDFVGDVRETVRETKSHGLVSFNSINEFGAANMVDVTDFLFMEIWRFYTTQLSELVDICHRNRAMRNQRVVLKLYPADMDPKQTAWPAGALARILGAAMTGGGSLMVVGEPDEKNKVVRGLNSMFYPDHQPLVSGNEEMIRSYYRHDAMWLGFTHGKNVHNTKIDAKAVGCITRTYAAPDHRALTVQLLRPGADGRWSSCAPLPAPEKDLKVSIPVPGGALPRKACYSSPDSPAFAEPVEIPVRKDGKTLAVTLPELRVHGTLVLVY